MHNYFILDVHTYDMNQLDIYVKPKDKLKLTRKAKKYGVSISKLLVTAALNFEGETLEVVNNEQ